MSCVYPKRQIEIDEDGHVNCKSEQDTPCCNLKKLKAEAQDLDGQLLDGKLRALPSIGIMDNKLEASRGTQCQTQTPPSDGGGRAAVEVMHNELVLQVVANKLAAKELWRLRKTSVLWNSTFIPKLRQTKSLRLLHNHHHEQYNGEPNRLRFPFDSSWLEYFIERVEGSKNATNSKSEIPFVKFHILGATYGPLASFISVCGKYVRELQIRADEYVSKECIEIERFRQMLFFQMPQLTDLNMGLDMLVGTAAAAAGKEGTDKNDLDELIEIPKLRRLTVCCYNDLYIAEIPSIMQFMNDILKCAVGLEYLSVPKGNDLSIISVLGHSVVYLDKLKCLKLSDVTIAELQILVELAGRKERPLRLKQFHVVMDRSSSECQQQVHLLHTFLLLQAPTMQELELELWSGGTESETATRILIPRMNSIRVFRLVRCDKRMKPVIIKFESNQWLPSDESAAAADEGGTMSTFFPALNRFECNYMMEFSCCTCNIWADKNQMVHNGVTELAMGSCALAPHNIGSGIWAQFSVAYPSVTKLELDVTHDLLDILAPILTTWPALTTLNLRYDRSDCCFPDNHHLRLDELLSGIPQSKYEFLNQVLAAEKVVTLDRVHQLHNEHKTLPGLADLKKLQRLVLDCRGLDDDSAMVTNIGGYFGFAMGSPSIQEMHFICSSRMNQISDNCRNLIRSAFSPVASICVQNN